jgi:hypothetical protein
MNLKTALISCILCCAPLSFAKTQKAAAPPATASQAQAASHAAAPQTQPAQNDELTEGLRMDLSRMESMVQQMEINLAQVDTSQSPLKHQFQLEIDTWRIMIRSMKRRLDAAGKK